MVDMVYGVTELCVGRGLHMRLLVYNLCAANQWGLEALLKTAYVIKNEMNLSFVGVGQKLEGGLCY
jgi:hypothetical protein